MEKGEKWMHLLSHYFRIRIKATWFEYDKIIVRKLWKVKPLNGPCSKMWDDSGRFAEVKMNLQRAFSTWEKKMIPIVSYDEIQFFIFQTTKFSIKTKKKQFFINNTKYSHFLLNLSMSIKHSQKNRRHTYSLVSIVGKIWASKWCGFALENTVPSVISIFTLDK